MKGTRARYLGGGICDGVIYPWGAGQLRGDALAATWSAIQLD